MENNITTLTKLLSRISSEYYRLSDFTQTKAGKEKFSPELTEAINFLGESIDTVSNLIELEQEKTPANNKLTPNVKVFNYN